MFIKAIYMQRYLEKYFHVSKHIQNSRHFGVTNYDLQLQKSEKYVLTCTYLLFVFTGHFKLLFFRQKICCPSINAEIKTVFYLMICPCCGCAKHTTVHKATSHCSHLNRVSIGRPFAVFLAAFLHCTHSFFLLSHLTETCCGVCAFKTGVARSRFLFLWVKPPMSCLPSANLNLNCRFSCFCSLTHCNTKALQMDRFNAYQNKYLYHFLHCRPTV